MIFIRTKNQNEQEMKLNEKKGNKKHSNGSSLESWVLPDSNNENTV